MIEPLHAIPGYGFIDAYNAINSDKPFAIKVRDVSIASTTVALHTLFATHHATRVLEHQIATRGYYSGRTHGWGAIRFMVTNPVSRAGLATLGVVAAGAGVSYAIAGQKGVQDYNEFISEPKHYGFRTG